ncbi:hypothetical protein PHYPO_G00028160 [Pangasianodon hypophthalmus]|uniref:AP-1 complex subunit sigma-2 n=2 Tax=Pangasiidae TaxID=7999 RepID=A0A5N5MXP5_PANHP|nr:hypothetical protein PHYPO_G00028160 [Pangasianodon hypophthalmus]
MFMVSEGCTAVSIHRRDPTTDRHGGFDLLRSRPGPVHPSLGDLVVPSSLRSTISIPNLVRTPDRHRPLQPRTPELKRSASLSLPDGNLALFANQRYVFIIFARRITLKMQFMLLFSRQGKLRLQKWYVPLSDSQKKKISREVIQMVLARKPKMCSFLEWRDLKIVYKRYASLYFCCAVEDQENELITLEIIHRYVELLDKYFGSVCELDIIFNFEKAYYILDEFILGGEAQETSKKIVLKAIEQADMLQEEAEAPRSVLEEIGLT